MCSKFSLQAVGNPGLHAVMQICRKDMKITGGRVHEISPQDLWRYVSQDQPDGSNPGKLRSPPILRRSGESGSVSAVALDVQSV
jgi:hypothetical protein